MAGRPKNTEPSRWVVQVKRWDFVQVDEVVVTALTYEDAVAQMRRGDLRGVQVNNTWTEETNKTASVVGCRKE